MSLAQRMMAAGLSAAQVAAIQGTVANGLVATGNSQATALALPADQNRFATVAAATGAILPAMNPGDEMTVINAGANALSLYPPVGAQINALGNNAAYAVATATPFCTVLCITPTQYHAYQSA